MEFFITLAFVLGLFVVRQWRRGRLLIVDGCIWIGFCRRRLLVAHRWVFCNDLLVARVVGVFLIKENCWNHNCSGREKNEYSDNRNRHGAAEPRASG